MKFWFQITLFSFCGIIVSVIALAFHSYESERYIRQSYQYADAVNDAVAKVDQTKQCILRMEVTQNLALAAECQAESDASGDALAYAEKLKVQIRRPSF